jgi:hypothetical protein
MPASPLDTHALQLAAAGVDGLSNGSQKVHTLKAIDQLMAAVDTWAFS